MPPGPSSPARPRRKPRWHYFFFVLAAFDVATVLFSLFLNHRVLDAHSRSVEESKAWAERLNQLAELGALAGAVNAPGNDVFGSRDIALERSRLRAARTAFEAALQAAETEIVSALVFPDAGRMRIELRRIREAMDAMEAEIEGIFTLLAGGKTTEASERMAVMDRHYARLSAIITTVSDHLQEIHANVLGEQLLSAKRLRRAEYLIAFAILCMVIAACVYGHRASRALSRAATERDRLLGELASANDALEARVADRTSQLSLANETLAHEIKVRQQAVEDLQRTQRELVESSRLAGMAEVATGVLHNVGNVLNSVNVSANLVVDQVRNSKTASLARAVQLMRDHRGDLGRFITEDRKGRQLPPFIEAVSIQLNRERAFLEEELRGLQQNVEHIKHIVSTQQSFAKVGGVRETFHLSAVLEDALRINVAALARHGIEIVRQLEPVPALVTDRHKVLQILVNLIANAKQALDARATDRRLAVAIRRHGADRVRVTVTDNGVGISPANLQRIFNHAFTTKKDGHGFGLHSGANAARELGGALSVHSEGIGLGATFTLDLPIAAPAASASPDSPQARPTA